MAQLQYLYQPHQNSFYLIKNKIESIQLNDCKKPDVSIHYNAK